MLASRDFRVPQFLIFNFAFLIDGARPEFCNDSVPSADVVQFENEISWRADGWAMLAPYGDFPGTGFRKNPEGAVERFPAIQRLDQAAARAMADKFNSPLARIKRFLSACPIYDGHPNTPIADGRYPDQSPKGAIVELQAAPDALYCKPVFYHEAGSLLDGTAKIFFSGHWTSDELPAENGKRIFRPDRLKSAGLTTTPNLPVEHINSAERGMRSAESGNGDRALGHSALRAPHSALETTTPTTMNKTIILTLLAAHGAQFTNDATDDHLAAALNALGAKAKTADTLAREKVQWANDQIALNDKISTLGVELQAAKKTAADVQAQFANERKARITGLLDTAITAGKITAAQRPDWERRLNDQTQFANEAEALGKLGPALKTVSILGNAGGTSASTVESRKVEIANASNRRDAVNELLRAEMERNGGNYDAAFATVRRNHPALFEAMRQPVMQK